MCLTVNTSATELFKKRNEGMQEIIVWKVLQKRGENYYGPYQSNKVTLNSELVAHPSIPHYTTHYSRVELHGGAIHVHLTRDSARRWRTRQMLADCQIFKCTAKLKNLIAVDGNGQAGFSKIFIPKSPSR